MEGTKKPISKDDLINDLPTLDKKLIDEAVELFVNSRIVNYNENENLYELAHDSLALSIAAKRSDEEIAILEVQRLIESQVNVTDEAREFFTEKQLMFIEPYLKKFTADSEEMEWIAKSRTFVQAQKDAEKKKQQQELIKTHKRLRTTYSLLICALIALAIAGYYWLDSSAQKRKAESAELMATIQKDTAVAARKVADEALKNVNEKIAIIGRKDFDDLSKRAESITDAGLCPNDILLQMDSIAVTNPDSISMKNMIQIIRANCPQ